MPTLDVLTGLSVADEGDFSVKQTQFKQTDSCATTKRPDILENMNIYDAKWGYIGSTEVTHIYRGHFHGAGAKVKQDRSSRSRVIPWTLFATPLTLHVQRATVIIQKGRGHLDSRQKGCSYPPKKTARETDLRLQRYKLVKSVMRSCRVVSGRVGSGRVVWRWAAHA